MKQPIKSLLLLVALASGWALGGANTMIIDVRTASEWSAGHLESAQHLELGLVAQNIQTLVEDKDQPIYLYCRSGNRSGQAKAILDGLGYSNVVNAGGLENASELLDQAIVR
ncbi:rhodanese-like domain-containing protein [Porticoccaceae bacterium]|jgi:phage shock protein E|nr:rhodanese-like domain-containing protein [Porticoccaceae bacterium]MBT6319662.1 rhodanese-like domain-containing protein [Porticoccaceae bacterium]MBT7258189.1 rhodanese-like domain-containing protein [Porticoccaceae bacterium]MBT7904789.1 rhodanese-like domain-containing protein [Porticoccaceae bacterium]MDA8903815.1 rhodanese-like domain-containing protein [Porticoccaceae bacterium]